MTTDISGVIRTLHETAVGRCRDRIEEAALRAKGLISHGEPESENGVAPCRPRYGVTSILKRKHGL